MKRSQGISAACDACVLKVTKYWQWAHNRELFAVDQYFSVSLWHMFPSEAIRVYMLS